MCPKSSLVNRVSYNAEGEDGDGKSIAAVESIAAGKFRKRLVVVLSPGGNVPKCRVEDDTSGRNCDVVVSGFG